MHIPVHIRRTDGIVTENIYGQFIEHILDCIEGGVYDPGNPLSDKNGIRQDVLGKMKELAPPVMRFPGGTVMCQYHWQDAVGPREKRIRRKNLVWGGELDPSFGTAEFVMLCRELGAEPMICVNMASGTPEEAGNWVEYCNGTGHSYYADLRRSHGYEEPFNVKYWCIGNECYAEPDIGIHNDVRLYVRDAMEFIKFMKLTDKSIKTLVVVCDDDNWNQTVLDGLHAVTDYVSYHHYSPQNGNGIYTPFYGEADLHKAIQRLEDLIAKYPEKVTDFNPWYRFPPRQNKIRISVDEWNIWDIAPTEDYGLHMRYNWRDALWTASVLNMFVSRPSIGLANLAQSVNVIAPILADRDFCWYQTIAYPLKLYRHNMVGFREHISYSSPKIDDGSSSLDALSISAVSDENGRIRIAAVNRDLMNSHTIQLNVEHLENISGIVTVLTGLSPDAQCTKQSICVTEKTVPFSGNELTLEPGSINLITLA